LEIIELPDSIALQTAIAENQSVIELAKAGGLKAYTYKKAAQSIQNLQNKILEYGELPLRLRRGSSHG
jgi:chromosome partitioning protein